MGKKRKAQDTGQADNIVRKRQRDEQKNQNFVNGRRNDEKDGLPKQKAGPKSALVMDARPDWHEVVLAELPSPLSDDVTRVTPWIEGLREVGRMLLDQEGTAYADKFRALSSHKFLGTIMSTGTMADKVSALTLVVRESPLHNMRAFDGLAGLAQKKSRGQAIYALEAMVDLLGPGQLLPATRQLRAFRNQPGLVGALQRAYPKGREWNRDDALPGGVSNAHLVYWSFEDWLKKKYFDLIQLLETWSRDEVAYFRGRGLDFVYGLLREKPEQESNLLALLVNKLGDKDRKLASRASYLLIQIQSTHPGMKNVILQWIARDILFRPGQSLRARYYAITTLNQTVIGRNESSIAEMLLRIYFDLFSTMLKGGEMSSLPSQQPDDETGSQVTEKVVSAILSGINRSAPFVDGDDDILESRLDVLFRIAHSSNFNTSIQALLLIQQLSLRRNVAVDRFYRSLYESLLDPRLSRSSKHTMYLNLLMRALNSDSDPRRVKAFAKRMLQISMLHQPPFASGVLFALSTLQGALSPLVKQPEEHSHAMRQDASDGDGVADVTNSRYNGRKRDPEYSNAHRSCLWEMVPNLHHFHPSVLVYASDMMGGKTKHKVEKPVIESLSLIRFLDKFSYRNPREKEVPKGGSIMQPLYARQSTSDVWLRSTVSKAAGNLNSSSFWCKRREHVAAEDVFFHEYFARSGKTGAGTEAGAGVLGADAEEEASEALSDPRDDEDGLEGMEEMDITDDADSDLDMEDWDSRSLSSASGDQPTLPTLDEDHVSSLHDETTKLTGVDHHDDAHSLGSAPLSREKERKRRIKGLPTFASAEDYEHLLQEADDDI